MGQQQGGVGRIYFPIMPNLCLQVTQRDVEVKETTILGHAHALFDLHFAEQGSGATEFVENK